MIKVCPNCGTQGAEKKITPGSVWLELLLWVVFFPLGLLYSLVRHGKRYRGCPVCGSPHMVPVGSARGQAILNGSEVRHG